MQPARVDWYSGSALRCAHAVAQTLLGHWGSVTHSILLHATTPSMHPTPSTSWCHTPHKLHSLGSASEETNSKQHEIDLPSLPLGFPVLGSPTSYIPTLLPTSDQGVSPRICLACGWHGESLCFSFWPARPPHLPGKPPHLHVTPAWG